MSAFTCALALLIGRSDTSDNEAAPAKAPAPIVKKPAKGKWEGEDEDDDTPVVRRPSTDIAHSHGRLE